MGLVEPFLITPNHAGGLDGRVFDAKDPLKTLTCKNRFGVVEPFVLSWDHQSGSPGSSVRGSGEPLTSITTKQRHGVVEPFLIQYYGNGLPRDLRNPLDTVTCNDRFALIDGCPVKLDIRFRMLKPHELAAAHSFPGTYDFAGGITDQVKQIGNSVPVSTAKALCLAALGGVA